MSSSATKSQFVTDCQVAANNAETLRIQMEEIATAYFKMGFNSGGSQPIVDADVSGNNLTAAKIASFITLAQQIGNLFGNAAVTQADYRSTNDQMRTN